MYLEIIDKESLRQAIDYMHDSGFKTEDIEYDKNQGCFNIVTREYEWEGKFIQTITNIAVRKLTLTLLHVKSFLLKEKNLEAYQTFEKDYIISLRIENNKLFIKANFHDLILEVDKIEGRFTSKKC